MSSYYHYTLTTLLATTITCLSACSASSNSASPTEEDMHTTTINEDMPQDTSTTDMREPIVDMNASQEVDQQESCQETPLYQDLDGDGQGSGQSVDTECLLPGQQPSSPELVRESGDCNDGDPLQYTGASGICNDRVDDDCDSMDEACPTSQPDSTTLPSWDCTNDSPPDNVYAWARFDAGNSNINPGCFVFFAAKKDLFYVQRVGLDDTDSCQRTGGCICQFDGGNGYDQRLYAFTTHEDTSSCEDIQLGDGQNSVSNACRKYLYHMYDDSRHYAFAANNADDLNARLEAFNRVEIACVKDVTFSSFPFQTILSTGITTNPNFVMPAN